MGPGPGDWTAILVIVIRDGPYGQEPNKRCRKKGTKHPKGKGNSRCKDPEAGKG
jgi:hypothetical protein